MTWTQWRKQRIFLLGQLFSRVSLHYLLWHQASWCSIFDPNIHFYFFCNRPNFRSTEQYIFYIAIEFVIVRVIKSRRLRWAGHVARMEEGRSASKILTGKPTGKRHLGRPRRRWEDNIRMDLEEIGINAGNWVDSAQDRNYWRALVNAALILRIP